MNDDTIELTPALVGNGQAEVKRNGQSAETPLRSILEAAAQLALSRQEDGSQERLDRIEDALNTLRHSQEPLARLAARWSEQQENLSHSLEQLRIKTDTLDRKLEYLGQEFIERHVTEPLFKQLLLLRERIAALTPDAPAALAGVLQSICEEIERCFDIYHLALIRPHEGGAFDPREHQILTPRPTADSDQHGRIGTVYHAGLKSDRRVLQPAQVEVFTFQPNGV